MDTTVIHGDDESCREADRLIAELSSELCALGGGDLDGGDAPTLIAYGTPDTPARTYHCERPPLGEKLEPAEAVDSPLWDRLHLERDPVVLEIPGDLPSAALTPDVLDYLRHVSVQSVVAVPVVIGGDRACLFAVESRAHRTWTRE